MIPVVPDLPDARSFQMSETKNQQSRQDMQHGHQNQEPKKGQSPNDPQNKHAQQDNPQKQGHNDSTEGQQRQGIGAPHKKEGKPTNL
jgi:hypothetical protein